jgi:protease IV
VFNSPPGGILEKKSRAVLGVLLLVFLFFIILMIFASYTLKVMRSDGVDFSANLGKNKPSIAVVEVNGVIMESRPTIELLEAAEKDKDTKAIILRINSPGGAVAPTQEIYHEMIRIDQAYDDSKGEKGKPIYASFGTIAASGGYYLGAAAREIYCNPGTLTGSIGVIMQFMDLSRIFELARLRPETIKSGRYKDIGAPSRAMTVEEKNLLETMVSGVHQQFITDIERRRKKKIKGDLKELAQGQIFSGEEAHKQGLVDHLGSLWDAGRKIHEQMKLEGEFSFKFIKKKKKASLFEILQNLEEASSFLKLDNIKKWSLNQKTPLLLSMPK